jgi:hypothetical protein
MVSNRKPFEKTQVGDYLVTQVASETDLLDCLRAQDEDKKIVIYQVSDRLKVLFGEDFATNEITSLIYHDFQFGRPINPLLLEKINHLMQIVLTDIGRAQRSPTMFHPGLGGFGANQQRSMGLVPAVNMLGAMLKMTPAQELAHNVDPSVSARL